MVTRVILALLAIVALNGCATVNTVTGNVAKIDAVATSVDPPAQVSVFLTAEAKKEPLDELMSSSFAIYEDGQLVEGNQSKQTLLEPDLVAEFQTVLLLDLAGSAALPQNRTALARAAATFVDHVRRTQSVAVYAFDGNPTPVLLAEFPRVDNASPLATIPEVESFAARDDSRDLRSNAIAALKDLNTRLMRSLKPIKVGTLVVFTQGPDLAGRVDEEQLYGHADTTQRDVVVIHLEEKPEHEIVRLGSRGLLYLDTIANAGPVFEAAAIRVRALKDRHYLLSYCSPSRSGKRLLRLEVTAFDDEGKEKQGTVDLEFDAASFGPGCDSNRTPSFGGTVGAAPVPPATTPVPTASESPAEEEPAAGESETTPTEGGIVPPPDRPDYGE